MTKKIINLSSPFNALFISVRDYGTHQESKLFRDKESAERFLVQDTLKELLQVNSVHG